MGVTTPDYYSILNQSGSFTVDGIDDVKEFRDTMVNKNHISEKIFFNIFPSSFIFMFKGLTVTLRLPKQTSFQD